MYKLNNILFFLIYVFVNPKLILLPFYKLYIPIYIQYKWLTKYNINTIIDVGAYRGHVSRVLHYLFPKADIYAFEPSQKNYNFIKSNCKINRMKISNYALIDRVSNTYLYIHPLPYLSSLLKINKQKGKYSYFNRKTQKQLTKTTTLDKYFTGKKLKKNIFLKIDTQGTESQVLKGGKNFLKDVSIIHVETSLENFYKNQDNFEKIYNFLNQRGFKYAGEAKESQFYPLFTLPSSMNSIFIKK